MEEDDIVEEVPTPLSGVGDRLREAREKADMDIVQVAAETRIPQRHLHSIEAGDFAALPSRTYALGFSRTYARLVGLDEGQIVQDVRDALASDEGRERPARDGFEPGDPARVPGRGLAWFALIAAVLFIGGLYAFYRSYFAPGLGPAPLRDDAVSTAQATDTGSPANTATEQPASADGAVVFTSEVEGTWVRFYDGEGNRLFEGIMNVGDRFTIPADADNPQIRTGRPYAFAITIGGRSVPRLSEMDEVVSDVPVSAQALIDRAEPAAAPPPSLNPASAPLPAAADAPVN